MAHHEKYEKTKRRGMLNSQQGCLFEASHNVSTHKARGQRGHPLGNIFHFQICLQCDGLQMDQEDLFSFLGKQIKKCNESMSIWRPSETFDSDLIGGEQLQIVSR